MGCRLICWSLRQALAPADVAWPCQRRTQQRGCRQQASKRQSRASPQHPRAGPASIAQQLRSVPVNTSLQPHSWNTRFAAPGCRALRHLQCGSRAKYRHAVQHGAHDRPRGVVICRAHAPDHSACSYPRNGFTTIARLAPTPDCRCPGGMRRWLASPAGAALAARSAGGAAPESDHLLVACRIASPRVELDHQYLPDPVGDQRLARAVHLASAQVSGLLLRPVVSAGAALGCIRHPALLILNSNGSRNVGDPQGRAMYLALRDKLSVGIGFAPVAIYLWRSAASTSRPHRPAPTGSAAS